MPCGGIYPKEGTWMRELPCYHCDLPCCELWCEEWDAPIHDRCVEEFLKTHEGQIILDHAHAVIRLPQRRPGKTTYVSCRLCGKVHEKGLPTEVITLEPLAPEQVAHLHEQLMDIFIPRSWRCDPR